MAPDSTCELESWRSGESPPKVEYSRAALEEVRRRAVEGLQSFGHGGLETGGALYGTRRHGAVRLLACAELPCEHAGGPAFALSGNDLAAFRTLLEKPPEGLEPVGWYVSHTRSGLALNEHDRRIFEALFPEPGAVAVVVHPSALGGARAGLFLRGEDGGLYAAGEEYELRPQAGRRAPPAGIEAELSAASVPAVKPARRARRSGWGAAIPAAAVAALIFFFLSFFWSRPGAVRLGLRAQTVAPGQIRIEWDRQSPAIRGAPSGVLEIQDGASRVRLPLNAQQLRSSSVTYAVESGDTVIHLRVGGTDEAVRFRGAGPRPAREAREAREREAPPEPMVRAPAVSVDPAPAREPPVEASVPANPPAPRRLAVIPAPGAASSSKPPPALPAPPSVTPERAAAELPFPAPAPLRVPSAPAASKPTPAPVPRSGRLIWTGLLDRRGVVEIEGGHASVGSLSGALPGLPVSLRVSPAQFEAGGLVVHTADAASNGRSEAAAAGNGWNKTAFEWDPERAREIAVLEAPNPSNQFRRLALRNEGRICPVIVIEWSAR